MCYGFEGIGILSSEYSLLNVEINNYERRRMATEVYVQKILVEHSTICMIPDYI